MTEIAKMLQLYGGWGVASLLVVALSWLAKYVAALHKEIRDDGKTMVATMVQVRDSLEKIHTELREQRR